MSDPAGFLAALQPASFRGLPFGVYTAKKVFGRRVAIHDYPFRDVLWVEDLGRRGRMISFTGFLVAELGGDVFTQQQNFIGALETAGPGVLVHPTLGQLNVSVADGCAINESADAIGCFELELNFIEAGEKVFPSATTDTQGAIASAAADADDAVASDFSTAATPQLPVGLQTALQAVSAVTAIGQEVQALAQDPAALFNLASALPGNFGRFFNGANLGGLTGTLASVIDPATTLDDLIGDATASLSAVSAAVDVAEGAAADLGAGASSTSPTDLATSVQGMTAALLAGAADPGDQIRLMSTLQAYVPA